MRIRVHYIKVGINDSPKQKLDKDKKVVATVWAVKVSQMFSLGYFKHSKNSLCYFLGDITTFMRHIYYMNEYTYYMNELLYYYKNIF